MMREGTSILGAVAAGLLCAMAGTAMAEGTVPAAGAQRAAPPAPPSPAAAQPVPIKPVKDPRALALLKKMSERLAAAKSFTVRARNIMPMIGPNGQWISLIGSARVALERPDKLFVERGGDQAAMDFYYNGKTLTLYAPVAKLYTEIEVPSTIDAMLQSALDVSENTFPYLEVLLSDPYAAMTADLDGAVYVGESTVDGVRTAHLALASDWVNWEIWIDATDQLPRMVSAKYIQIEKMPTILTEMYDWKLNPHIPAATFVFEKAPDAQKIVHKGPPEPAPAQPGTAQ
jgi:hypothetical protein